MKQIIFVSVFATLAGQLQFSVARAESVPIKPGLYAKATTSCDLEESYAVDRNMLIFRGDGLNNRSTQRWIRRQRSDGNTYILDLDITREDNGGRSPEKRTWLLVVEDREHIMINGEDRGFDRSGAYRFCHALDPSDDTESTKEARLTKTSSAVQQPVSELVARRALAGHPQARRHLP